eukprot:9491967-Pyramimonas_sp.AAC.1
MAPLGVNCYSREGTTVPVAGLSRLAGGPCCLRAPRPAWAAMSRPRGPGPSSHERATDGSWRGLAGESQG